MDQSDHRQKCFPPFLWLLRDFLVCIPERYDTPTEYLKIEVLSGDDSDSMKAAVLESLTQCFPSFECKTLPSPSTDAKVMANISTNLSELESLFNKGVDELSAFVKQNIKAKQLFDKTGTQCDGPTFALFVKEITEAANSPDSIPDIDNTWKMVVESRCKAVQESLLVEYTKTMKERYDKISEGGPLEEVADEKSLMKIHDTLWSEVKKQLHDEVRPLLALEVTKECTLETVTDQLEKQLIQTQCGTGSYKIVVGGALFPFIEENRKRSQVFCEKLFSELYAPIKKKVQGATSEVEYTPEQLAADVEKLFGSYYEQSFGPEKGNVLAQMKATIDQNKELFEKHLHQVLQHAKQEREMQNELRETKEKSKQIDDNFKELRRQLEEFEERRQKEVKELRNKVEEQAQRGKKMAEEEMKRRVEEAKQLAAEGYKREVAEKELKELQETYRRTKEEAIIKEKMAENKLQNLQNLLTENKLEEKKRKKKAERDINKLRAQINAWQQQLEQKEKDHTDENAAADAKIKEIEEKLKRQEKKSAEERDEQENKLREKQEELHQQKLKMDRMEAEYEVMMGEIKVEKEKEKELRKRAEKENRSTLDRLDKAIKNGMEVKERLERELEEQVSQKEEEKDDLSRKIKWLKDNVKEFNNKSYFFRIFTNPDIPTD